MYYRFGTIPVYLHKGYGNREAVTEAASGVKTTAVKKAGSNQTGMNSVLKTPK